jgi:hypothetical protein
MSPSVIQMPTEQVRHVLEVKDGKVKHEARGKTDHGGSWGACTTMGMVDSRNPTYLTNCEMAT